MPYYVINFEHVLFCVIEETDDRDLFNDEELEMVKRFHALDLDSKKVYVRLFQRKHSWLTKDQIKYEEIQDLKTALDNLVISEFMETGCNIDDLETLLKLLSAPNVKSIAKEMNIHVKGTQKADFIAALIKHSKRQCVFFKSGKNVLKDKMTNK